ncbi:MAG: hypothetical protein WC532_09085 [Candidatus Omnitrophota bacterium]
MKTKITLDLEVKMGNAKTVGTNCVGYMPDGTTYKDLVRVFGNPQQGLSADGKIQAEWTGSINGLAFTIYDYKAETGLKANRNWHIGGRTPLAAELLKAYFNSVKNNRH